MTGVCHVIALKTEIGVIAAAARGVPPGHERWSETAAQVTETSDRSRLFGVAPVTVSFVLKKKCNAVTEL